MSTHWGYSKHNGPLTWPKQFPLAAGLHQSPIDIQSKQTLNDEKSSQSLTINYNNQANNDYCNTIINTGHGWQVSCTGKPADLSGGPLKHKYILEQFHCHWGSTEHNGSEHTVDGQCFAGELHFVHWNAEKYISFASAAQSPDGLAVLGVFLEVGKCNTELLKITALLPRISYKGDKGELKNLVSIDINKLLPKNLNYWCYDGSLTTPPCSETVKWIVFKEPIQISKEQLAVFRTLKSYCRDDVCPKDDDFNGYIVHNKRPTLPLGNRTVLCCDY